MNVDPVSGALISSGINIVKGKRGKDAAEKSLGYISKNYNSILQILNGDFKIVGKSISLLCSEQKQKCSYSLKLDKKPIIPRSVPFTTAIPSNVQLISFAGCRQPPGSVEITNDGFKINLNKLSENEPYYLNVEYPLDDSSVIDNFVRKTYPKDVPHNSDDGTRCYEISASLMHLDTLSKIYDDVNLEDVSLDFDVTVNQDIAIAIPKQYLKRLESLIKISDERDLNKQWSQLLEYRRHQKEKDGGSELKKFDEIQSLFLSYNFQHFLEVKGKDFNCIDCRTKNDAFRRSSPAIPEAMKVITKTNLSLEKPGANGTVIYKYMDFISEIQKILSSG